MTFVFNEEDASKTVNRYERNGCNFHVTYVDGSEGNYYISTPEEEVKRLENEMVKAIALRAKQAKIPEWRMYRMILGEILMLAATGATIKDENALITSVFLAGTVIFGRLAIKELLQRKELKKYDMIMEMYNDLDVVNSQEYKDSIEFDHFYQKDLSLSSADDFTYGEVRSLYKKYKSEK